jgi:hypothetical protein
MTQKLLATLMALGLASSLTPRAGAQDALWTPPQNPFEAIDPIDAINIYIPPGQVFEAIGDGVSLFTPGDTVNWTNQGGTMLFVPGFEFQTFPTGIGAVKPAGNFVNEGGGLYGGIIEFGSPFSLNYFAALEPASVGKVLITVTNKIVSSGSMLGDPYSLVRLTGKDIDLSRGTIDLTQAAPDLASNLMQPSLGWLDGYWGLTNNVMIPYELIGGFVPASTVTNRDYTVGIQQLAPVAPVTYETDWLVNESNTLHQILILSEPNPSFVNRAFFDPNFGIFVQWQWNATNWPSGVVSSNNYLILEDSFGEVTNFQVGEQFAGATFGIPNIGNGAAAQNPTYIPVTYSLTLANTPLSSFYYEGQPTSSANLNLPMTVVTNNYAAYEAIFTPMTQLPTDIVGGNVTNVPGRIEINASGTLDLTEAKISSPNYLLLKATNNFVPVAGAQISAPNADLYLGVTNASFAVSNFMAPYINHLSGPCELWSARWTNVVTNFTAVSTNIMTNSFHVLVVSSSLSTVVLPQVQTLSLTVVGTNAAAPAASGDLFISDVLNVNSNLTLNARTLTITTNETGTPPAGQLNFFSPIFSWPDAVPSLQALTNWGQISALTSLNFAESPFNRFAATQAPYQAFVNHGLISDYGTFVWSRYFENSGIIESYGTIQLRQAEVGCLTNGMSVAILGNIDLAAQSLLISNHQFQAGSSLSLTATNMLTDGVVNLGWLAESEMASRLASDPILQGSFGGVTNLGALTSDQLYQLMLLSTNLLTATVNNGNAWSCYNLQLTAKPVQGDLLGTTITSLAATNQTTRIVWAGEDRGMDVYNPTNSGFLNNAAVGRLILDGVHSTSRFILSGPATGGSYALYVDSIEFLDATATNLMNDAASTNSVLIDSNMKVYYAQAKINGESIAEKLSGQNSGRFIWVSNYNYGYFSSSNVLYQDSTTHRLNAALVESCHIISNTNQPLAFNCHPNFPGPVWPITFWSPAVADTPVLPMVQFTNNSSSGSNSVPPSTNNVPSGTNGTSKFGFRPPASGGNSTTVAGSYSGLFADTNNGVAVSSAGYFTATTTSKSNFTAKIVLGGHTYSLSGRFDPATGLGTNKPVRLSSGGGLLIARLQLDVANDQIRGTLSNVALGGATNWSAEVLADRLVFSQTRNPARTANYTIIIPPDTNSVAGPSGYGVGTVKFDAGGKVKWSGTLADGTKVTQSGAISSDGYWPLFASLYSGKGLVVSWIQVETNDLGGALVWLRPSGVTTKSYLGSFTNAVNATGLPYTSSAVAGPVHNSLTFSAGDLPAAFSDSFNLDSRLRLVRPVTNQLKLNVTASSGLFSGSISIPQVEGRVSFQGVLFPSATNGFGFFLNAKQSGAVSLSPAP